MEPLNDSDHPAEASRSEDLDFHQRPELDMSDADLAKLQELLANVEEQPALLQMLRHESFAGPLPPPEMLKKYNDLVSGAGDEIVNQWREQGRHRRELEQTVINSEQQRADLGLRFGLAIAITGFISGTFLVYEGFPIVGAIFAGAPLSGLVGVFIYGTQSRRSEREQKYDRMHAIPENHVD